MSRSSLRFNGFTLTELVVVIALMLALLSATYLLNVQTVSRQEFERARETVHRELWHARADTIANTKDSAWGVNISTHTLTRYRGNSYASRAVADDVVHTFSNQIDFSNTGDITFERPEGTINSAKTITITDQIRTATTTVHPSGILTNP